MKDKKKSGLGILIICIGICWLLKNIIPAIANLFVILTIACGIGFIILLVAIIVSGLKSGEQEGNKPAEGEKRALTADEKKAIDKTKSTVTQIRIASARVNDSAIRNSFTAICDKTDKILGRLKDDPTDFQTGRRVINYYTSSVAEIESKFIKLQDSGTDISDTPEKLKENLAEINSALDKLYDSLFDDDKLDLTVEMKALSIALKRDGLIDNNFAKIVEDFTLGKVSDEEMLEKAEVAEEQAQ